MKLVYFIQENTSNSNYNIHGVFNDIKKAFKAVIEKIGKSKTKVSFKIIECPMDKNIEGGIVIYYVESNNTSDHVDVLKINPIYEFGGIKKWVNDQQKAARKS